MSVVLSVKGLSKQYPKFRLHDVSFEIQSGTIMGLIGRNGAGKTTTIKSILNLVHSNGGEITYFGLPFLEHEGEIKQRIGYAGGAVDYYKKKRIRDFVAITKRFYNNWDENAYKRYMGIFSLDEDKSPSELSEGMKVKLSIANALSHRAELLILDEPTSGLDPVSREELLDIFRRLANENVAILFSTHITSDLDKCADYITYIREGTVQANALLSDYICDCAAKGIGENLEEIMIHYEKEALREKFAG